jgi:hypothetical protein
MWSGCCTFLLHPLIGDAMPDDVDQYEADDAAVDHAREALMLSVKCSQASVFCDFGYDPNGCAENPMRPSILS